MIKKESSIKYRGLGLYGLAMARIESCSAHNGLIRFPDIFSKLCRSYSISKREAWDVLGVLRDFGLIEIVAGHGVRLK